MVKIISEILKTPVKNRSLEKLSKLIPFVKELPMFRDNGMKDNAITEMLSLMTYREADVDESVIEYGSFGDEFYVILEGECEVMVPDK